MDRNDLLLEQWKMAAELHRHGNEVTWNRFNYFIAMNGVLASAAAVVYSSHTQDLVQVRLPLSMLFLFGSFVSWAWFLAHCRGEAYNRYRQHQAGAAEDALKIEGEQILTVYANGLEKQKLVDVPWVFKRWPGLTVYAVIRVMSFVIAAVWFLLAVATCFFIT